jgi:hypothetical protein
MTDGTFGKVQNVGMDANSPKDDFGYWIDTKSRRFFLFKQIEMADKVMMIFINSWKLKTSL